MKDDNISEQLENKKQDILYLYYEEIYKSLKTGDVILHKFWLNCLTNFMSNSIL
jgi:hypothetical protein